MARDEAKSLFADEEDAIEVLEKEVRQAPEKPSAKDKEDTVVDKILRDEAPKDDAKAKPEASDDDEDVEGNKGEFVRREALRAEREKRKARDRELKEVQAKYAQDMARANERLTQIMEAQQRAMMQQQAPVRQAPQQPEIPAVDVDPIGHFQAKLEAQERRLAEYEAFKAEQVKSQQAVTQEQRIIAEVQRLEEEFRANQPDYNDAQQALADSWRAEARAAGLPEQAVVKQRIWEIINVAAQQNANPGKIAYELARARGYQPNAATRPAQQPQGPSLDTLRRGVESSRSSNTVPSSAPSATPALDALLAMDEFDLMDSLKGNKWEKLKDKLARSGGSF